MTIEFSLRRRAFQSRCISLVWLLLTVIILVGTYLSIPMIIHKALIVTEKYYSFLPPATNKDEIYVVIALVFFCLLAIGFACFVLSRSAFIENELAAWYYGLADTLCITGNNFEDLEKVAHLMIPKNKPSGLMDMISKKDHTTLMSILKVLRP